MDKIIIILTFLYLLPPHSIFVYASNEFSPGGLYNPINVQITQDPYESRRAENIQTEKNSKNIQQTNIKKLKSAYGSAPIKDQFIDKSK